MIVKIHKNENNKIVAICDNDLIGKKFCEGDLRIEINEFYKGKEMNEEEILQELNDATIVNLVGEESIRFGLRHRLISKENIIKIKGVLHAQGLL